VRWLLDVPDTRFTATRTRGAGGAPGWTFRGSGWGHGVGLCQVGSFGMAGRGLDYRAILEHYYTGVELVRVRSRSPLWGDPPAVPELGVGAGR
jgi:peptidoglycan hydrolase-like amidase